MKQEYLKQCSPVLLDFLGYMENVKGRSQQTVDEYFLDLRTFFRFVKQLRGSVPADLPEDQIPVNDVDIELIRTITLNDVYEYMNYAKNERQNGKRARARKTTSLRVFFRYLTDYKHLLANNPVQYLDSPKLDKKLPKFLSLEQSKELLQIASGEFAERDYCMLTLLLNCGLRRAEVAAINLEDIGHQDHTLLVHGKGGKERVVYLNGACCEAIDHYLRVRPVDGVRDKRALFLSHLKQRMSAQGVYYVVKGYLKQIEGAENLSTHKLRHTAATLMYQYGGVDIRVLKEILGHENLGTTEIYTHLSNEQVQSAMERNPLSHEVHAPRKDQAKK